MEEKIRELTELKLEEINVKIDKICFIKSNNQTILDITIVSDLIVDLELIVKASKIIKNILDDHNFIEFNYIMDCHSKEGGNSNEQ